MVIIRYATGTSITIGGSLTSSTATDGGDTVVTFTAGSDTVTLG